MVLILLPLTWAILVYMVSGVFNAIGLTITIIGSFIFSAIVMVSLSSLKILDSGLSDGTSRILFILIFGGLFYGGTIAQTYLANSPQIQIIGLDGNNITVDIINMQYQGLDNPYGSVKPDDWANMNFNNIPSYIIAVHPQGQNWNLHFNANYNSTETNPNLGTTLSFGEGANSINDVNFQDMPYYSMVNLIFALMYMLGLYFLVAG